MRLDLTKIPTDMLCPISTLIMLDPVVDFVGNAYEREEISAWFEECQKKKRQLTSPSTNEEFSDDRLVPARALKNQITAFLEKFPDYWEMVYISGSLKKLFLEALTTKNRLELERLIKIEPRFVVLNNDYTLIKWIVDTQDLVFFRDVVITQLLTRGQKQSIPAILSFVAQAGWAEGLHLLITQQNWNDTDYDEYATQWIGEQKVDAVKTLLSEMHRQKISLNKVDNSGDTLLHKAASAGAAKIIETLLCEGFDSNARNNTGVTPQDIAATHPDPNVLAIFKAFHVKNQSSLQLQTLQAEIQELKSQLADVKAHTKQELHQISSALQHAGSPIFTFIKQKSYKNYFTPTPFKMLKGHKGAITSISILPGDFIVSASVDKTLKIWDSKSGECLATLTGHTGKINSCEVLSDGSIVSVSADKTLKIWNSKNGKCLATLKGHRDEVNSCIILSSDHIVSMSDSESIVWDKDGNYLTTLDEGANEDYFYISTFVKLPDCIITSSYNYNYKDIQTNDGQQSTRREHHVTNGAFKVWNIKTGQCIKAVNLENKKFPRSFTILADGLILSEVVAPSRTHGPWEKNTEEFQLWDIEKDCCLQIFKKSSFPTGNFVNGSDNDHVLHCIGKNIYVWNIKRGELLQKLMGHTGKILETVMLPDGHLVTSSEDKSIKVWNTDTGECLQTIDQPAKISGLAILADGSLVSSFNDGSMTIRKLHPVLRDLNQANKSIEANFPQCKVQ